MLPAWTQRLPLSEQGLAWLMPTVVALVLAIIWDRAAGRQVTLTRINQRQQTV
jgi:LIVCS family branched-chain amino acid:cation transporter